MRRGYVILALGISVCLIGALLMFEGSILGERTTGIATVIGIVGIGLTATSGATIAGERARSLKPKN